MDLADAARQESSASLCYCNNRTLENNDQEPFGAYAMHWRPQSVSQRSPVILKEDEHQTVVPWIESDLVMCPLGQSIYLGPKDDKTLQFPYRCVSSSIHLCSTGNAPRGLMILPVLRPANKPLRIVLRNLSDEPIQLGSRCALVAFMIDSSDRVIFERTNGKTLELKKRKSTPVTSPPLNKRNL